MKIFNEINVAEIIVGLLEGKTAVFPTETSYGLGCDATNQQAVDRIFKIKGRRSDKPLLIVVPSIEMAKKYLVWNDLLEKIAKKYWPGPITVVGESREPTLASGVVSKENTVAVRVTAHPLLKSMAEKFGRPLVATSANLADTGDMYDSQGILDQFENRTEQPDLIFDYGVLPKNKPTTIVSVAQNNLHILRQGEVEIDI